MNEQFNDAGNTYETDAAELSDALFEPQADEAALSGYLEDEEADDDILAGDEGDADDGEAPLYMQNRELSWLTFNERVLDQGADESVPLLERLNFISIFWSNLQEFFMVRVGSLTDLSYIEPPAIDSKTGMTPNDQIKAIHERCHELYPIQESTYEHVRGQLAKEGVRHLRPDDLSEEQRNYLFGLVRHNIEPFLSPQIINARHPFPHLENGKLYILVRLDDEASEAERKKKKKKKDKDKLKKEKGGAEGVVLGLIPLPHQCERVIKLPGRGYQFILLEHAIEMFVPEIFNMYKIKHTNVVCVTRNADIDANQGFDEQDEDYREHMKRLLKQRARLAPVRLECERPLSPVMEKVMLKKLGLKRFQMYDTIVPLDLSFTWGLGSRLTEKKREKLSNPSFTPAWPAGLDRSRRIMDQVAERDVLLSYPYESMDPFVQLLREAANDPDVISIKITLYRLASQSHVAEALIAAADAGKEVTALFELRARFDENNNIEWSQRFEQAGCNVLYGFRNYKVHSKICCITRRTPEGTIQHITQLGTGNYNEKTARLYTDFSFITANEEFADDAVEFFRNMQLENLSDSYRVLRVAPLQIKSMLIENLDKQIERAKAGLPASAFMKANSITDKDVIEKISEASNAGVRITLFIRGICCLIPRVKGATGNVRVVSIVGRLLEHSRIYCFGSADDCVVYLSSADLMTRNLNKRVEIAWPLPAGEIRDKVLSYIDVCMHDTAKLRELRPNATYTPLGAFCDLDEDGNPEPSFDAQAALIERSRCETDAPREGADETAQDERAVEEPVLDEPAQEEFALEDSAQEESAFDEASRSQITERIPIIVIPEGDAAPIADDEALGAIPEADSVAEEPYPQAEDAEEPVEAPEAAEEEPVALAEAPEVAVEETVAVPEVAVEEPVVLAEETEAAAEESEAAVEEPAVVAEEPEAAVEEPIAPAEEPIAPVEEPEEDLTELTIDEILSPIGPSKAEAPLAHEIEQELETSFDGRAREPFTLVVPPEPEPVAEPAPEPEPVPEAVAEPEPAPELEPVAEPELVIEAMAAPEPAPEPAVEPEPAPEPEPEIEPVTEAQPIVEIEPGFDLEKLLASDSKKETEPTPVEEPAQTAESAPAFLNDLEILPMTEPEPEPALEPEPVVEPEPSLDSSSLESLLQQSAPVATAEDAAIPDAAVESREPVSVPEPSEPVAEPEVPAASVAANTSDRVSELIAQLSATPGQNVPLQEDVVQPIQPLPAQSLESALSSIDLGETKAAEPAADLGGLEGALNLASVSDTTVPEEPVSPEPVQEAVGEPVSAPAPEPVSSVSVPEVPAPAEPEAPMPSAQPDAGKASEPAQSEEEAVPSFFDGPNRDIEMPPEKQGFFSRFRNNG